MTMRRLPFHVVLSFLAAEVVGLDIVALCLMGHGHVGRFVTASAAFGMMLGAIAGMCRRTWGVGLVLASASAFFVSGALGMGPPFFFAVAAVGALPFALTAKYMARFDFAATILFALGAGTSGLGASVAWCALAPTIVPMFAR